jgi:putative Mn2+ efflux pump MntP
MMPVIGWGAGLSIRIYIERYDHWVAFALLTLVAINMIRGAFQHDKGEEKKKDPTKGITLVILSVATSIDALAVGLSISILNVSIWTPALIIGIVAGIFSIVGLQIGKRIGSATRLSRYADAIGGIVLLAIGIKILHEHGVLSFL